MSCLGVLFAIDKEMVQNIKSCPREELPDFISEELEEDYFANHRDRLYELDKSWDAMHRLLSNGTLLFGQAYYPLSGAVLGGKILYGDKDGEDDYIISLKTPKYVADVTKALAGLSQDECRERYFKIDESEYGMTLGEDDFAYTWEYLSDSLAFWEKAVQNGQYVLFTVDQ